LIVNGQRDAAYSLMAPLSKRDADWRVQYLLIGTSIIRGQQEALDWLLDPAGGTDTDEPRLRLMQIDAVVAIADRHRSAEALAAAAKLAASIEAKPDAPAMASFVLGTIHEKQGDFAAAEQAYRRALAAEPGKAIYANNLAMALAHQNKSLDEAIKLAQGVCEAQPNDPNYFDTLAYVLLKADRCDEALAAIERAIALAPQDAQWIERRAEIREHCAPKPVPEPAE